jgi:HSP20 family protein
MSLAARRHEPQQFAINHNIDRHREVKIMAETKGTKEATEQQNKQETQQTQTGRQSQAVQATGREGTRQRGLVRREPFAPSPWPASPFAIMNRFANEMDRLFEDFGFGRGLLAPRGFGEISQSTWSPQIEVFEGEGQIVVRADLPGLSKDDVKVDITDDALTIQGERRHEHEQCDESFCRSERSFGSFYRSIPLPEGADADNAKANFRDGVLEVTIPAPERAQRRRQIEIGEGNTAEKQPRADAQTTTK